MSRKVKKTVYTDAQAQKSGVKFSKEVTDRQGNLKRSVTVSPSGTVTRKKYSKSDRTYLSNPKAMSEDFARGGKKGVKKYKDGGTANAKKVAANKAKVEQNTRKVEANAAKLNYSSSLPKGSVQRQVDSASQQLAFKYAVDRLKAGKMPQLSNPKSFPGNQSQIKKENMVISSAMKQMPKSTKLAKNKK
jgi:hypothetical protein